MEPRPNFGSRLLRFRDIAGFVSQMPLLYIPPRRSLKIWRCFPRVRSMSKVVLWVSQISWLSSRVLFSENINLFNQGSRT